MVAKELTYYTVSQVEYFRIFIIGFCLGWWFCIIYYKHNIRKQRLSTLKKFIPKFLSKKI